MIFQDGRILIYDETGGFVEKKSPFAETGPIWQTFCVSPVACD